MLAVDVREFDFDLPQELIAQEPRPERTSARLLCLNRRTGDIRHSTVADLPQHLDAGDVLVVNNTCVFPARLIGRRVPSGGIVECLLIRRVGVDSESTQSRVEVGRTPTAGDTWEALMHPGQKLRVGAQVVFDGRPTIHGEVLERRFFGRRVIRLWTDDGSPIDAAIDKIGHVPLPPYIHRADCPSDRDRYQTMFAQRRGSVAAPTAGLHFTPALVDALKTRGVEIVEITLHVGYGTFQPVRADRVEDHRIEPERYEIGESAAERINRALAERRRLIAVGTTTTRTLEGVAFGRPMDSHLVATGRGEIDLFIYPGFTFRVVGGLLTNFHLPRSSLLMLVSAFAGRDRVLAAYREAIDQKYRFYSYGDAMLIL